MTKEQFIDKWQNEYDSLGEDLDAVLANEIAKVQEAQTEKQKGNCSTFDMSRLVDQDYKATEQFVKCICTNSLQVENCIRNCGHGEEPEQETVEPAEQPEPNPIEQAYERGEKIRKKHWASEDWIKKISETESIDENGKIWITSNDFKSIKTMPDNWELYPEPAEQPAKPFDKERFEAMFRAVIETHEATMNSLKQLDAYYATKNN